MSVGRPLTKSVRTYRADGGNSPNIRHTARIKSRTNLGPDTTEEFGPFGDSNF